MDIEFCVPQQPQAGLFRPIEQFAVADLYQQSVTLENTFSSSSQNPDTSILLTLINNTLLLSDATADQVTPHAAVELDFDLKF